MYQNKIAWFGFAAIAFITSGCSQQQDDSPLKKLFMRSELHQKGKSCGGEYFAFRGGNFTFSQDGNSTVLLKDVSLNDIGSNRLSMISDNGSFKMVTTFLVTDEGKYATIENVDTDHKLSQQEWDAADTKEASFREKARELEATPTIEICVAKS